MEDLALAIQEDAEQRGIRESLAIPGLVAAEETVVKKATLEIKELQECQVSQGLRGSLDKGDQGEIQDVMEILVLREILASLNATS